MPDTWHLAADRAPADQLTLGLQVRLDPEQPLGQLAPGDRFLLEGLALEGRVVRQGGGSVTVTVRGADERWNRTTWSPGTRVRRFRG
jgi:hypothetical protein